jgi:hypothetical protein
MDRQDVPENLVSEERERFIPFRKKDIVDMLLAEGRLAGPEDRERFAAFCRLLEAIFHFEFHDDLERMKDGYFPLNPDLSGAKPRPAAETDRAGRDLLEALRQVLDKANFDLMSMDEILESYQSNAELKVRLKVDTEDFETVELYRRGRHQEHKTIKKYWGLKKERIEFPVLDRVILLARVKSAEHLAPDRRPPFPPGTVILKAFKDVPEADVEMLFPDVTVAMRLRDKLLLTVPAVVGGVPLLVTKVLPAVVVLFVVLAALLGIEGTVKKDALKASMAALSALVALGGYCLRQWMKYKNKRVQFQKDLIDNLYLKNTVNNSGVFHWLIDTAEESECKESFLAYHFLLCAESPPTKAELDQAIERWLADKHGVDMDFEIGDALEKLERLQLLIDQDGRLSVPPLEEALRILDRIWDDYFPYHRADAAADGPRSTA